MKYLVLVPDGAADYPLEELDGKTPLEAAHTPNMDRLAREGRGGLVQVIPPERPAGSDVGNLEIFGYDTRLHYTGRAPIEAASMGIELGPDDIAFRCNLIHRDGDVLVDYSAGHISTEEGVGLIEGISPALVRDGISLYAGIAYRHILVIRGGPEDVVTHAPHDIMGQSIAAHLPAGEGSAAIRQLMAAAEPGLAAAPINAARVAAGRVPANAIWLWGSGRALTVPSLKETHGLRGGVISAVDLVRGIGRCAGLEILEVPGITGYLDTNYTGKAEHALAALDHLDFVYVHVEAPDEAGHNANVTGKVQALEDFDALVVGRILEGLSTLGEGCRLLMTPDHRTPIAVRTHTREPVPFVLWGEGIAADAMVEYSETGAEAGAMRVDRGHRLLGHLVGDG